MAKFVIAACPLVKVFLPEWHERLLEDPDTMMKDEDFSFDVPRGTCAFRVRFNQPVEVSGRNDSEVLNIYNWLTGGYDGREFPETDSWGLVPYEPKIDLARRLDEMARLEVFTEDENAKTAAKAQKDLARIRKEAKEAMLFAREDAKAKSEARIVRAMRINHNNLVKQWQLNEEQKMGKYPPSPSEMLGAHALANQIQAANAKRAAIMDRMSKLMTNQVV